MHQIFFYDDEEKKNNKLASIIQKWKIISRKGYFVSQLVHKELEYLAANLFINFP